jgi:hypothetical protein
MTACGCLSAATPGQSAAVLPCSHCCATPLLQGTVRRFFHEKEVTSTLVMDALYCGAKLLEDAGRHHLAVRQAVFVHAVAPACCLPACLPAACIDQARRLSKVVAWGRKSVELDSDGRTKPV